MKNSITIPCSHIEGADYDQARGQMNVTLYHPDLLVVLDRIPVELIVAHVGVERLLKEMEVEA